MVEIARRLRESATQCRAADRSVLLKEAADEIDRLTAECIDLRFAIESISGASLDLAHSARMQQVDATIAAIRKSAAQLSSLMKATS